MKMFLLGMISMYLLLNTLFVIYVVITEWKVFRNLKKDRIKMFLIMLSMFFIGVPFAIKNRENF